MALYLGLDGGGSSSRVRVRGIDPVHRTTYEDTRHGGPLNVTTLPPAQWRVTIDGLLAGLPEPTAAVVCIAGVRSTTSRRAVLRHLRVRFPAARLRIEPDFVAALECFDRPVTTCVVAGTGSIVCSRDQRGGVATTGGEGPRLGDRGSAFRLGARALAYDPAMAARRPWATTHRPRRSRRSRHISRARRSRRPDRPPRGRRRDGAARSGDRGAPPRASAPASSTTHRAGRLRVDEHGRAGRVLGRAPGRVSRRHAGSCGAPTRRCCARARVRGSNMIPPTEQPHPDSSRLGSSTPADVVALMNRAERRALDAVSEASVAIARAAELVADVYGSGGRIAYLATGTSGMLCALDAAELPATFGVDPARYFALVTTSSGPSSGPSLLTAGSERGRHRTGDVIDEVGFGAARTRSSGSPPAVPPPSCSPACTGLGARVVELSASPTTPARHC